MKKDRYHRKVFYYETDKMGIVHHANYIRMMEEARIHLLENLGLPYDRLEEMGLMIPVLHAECKYKIPLRFGDAFQIDMVITEMTGVRMSIVYTIYGEDGITIHATGSTKHAFVDEQLHPIRLRRRFPEVYEMLLMTTLNKKEESK
ncbi:acyl-CoA thioesterase [Alkalibacter rhizosphaerae]|uniref:Acyl-CoA thioesterase n=1 Tax=Alkalibacter rhizosphaerae TaxID=2815577 RepID=A0A975AID4_9FIRM|nr:thioesterase family protein [Alkalibacter rhizosphaerae]QSX09352.1 acyl-CoA thioesterase [Alkalibacter rhizosphaerae]